MNKRIYSLDTLKAMAMFFVCWIHAKPFYFSLQAHSSDQLLFVSDLLRVVFRFAVPFFYIVSGYFIFKSFENGKSFQEYSKRLIKIVVFWSMFYLIVPAYFLLNALTYDPLRALYWHWLEVKELLLSPVTLIFEGGKYHLWFVVSLIWAVGILYFFKRQSKEWVALVLGIVLYGVALLGKTYAGFESSLEGFHFRYGPFLSLIFVTLGYYLAKEDDKGRHAWGWFVGGVILCAIELYFLKVYNHVSMEQEMLIATIPVTVGLFKLALKYPMLCFGTRLPEWGSLTLGIYILHVFVLETLEALNGLIHPVFWDILLPTLTFMGAVILTKQLKSHRLIGQFLK